MPHAVLQQRPFLHPHQLSEHLMSTSSHPSLGNRLGLPYPSGSLDPGADVNMALPYGRSDSLHPQAYPRNGESLGQPKSASYIYSTTHPYNSQNHNNGEFRQGPNHKNPRSSNSSPKSHKPSKVITESMESSKPADTSLASALRIPSTIRTPQSGLPQLAAEITCLFWFEDASTLDRILDSSLHAITPLESDAAPSIGFRKWVSMILSTTQVTPNVILLALLFVYRLKKVNPTVKGKPGSEFRLLTVALMLGNKFLDDNTYTNKTWAEVSGISVQEVHVMEVEFLSNMRYSLFCSEDEWKEWHGMLGRFGTYIHRAARLHETFTITPSIPAPLQIQPNLPSPPTSDNASPSFSAHSPLNATGTTTPLLLPTISSTAVSPIGSLPELNLRPTPRKRSYDESAAEPPAKRVNRSGSQPAYQPTVVAPTHIQLPHPQITTNAQLPRLPTLSVQTTFGINPPAQLPPLQFSLPARPAMSLVYPNPATLSQPGSHAPSLTATPAQNFARAHFDSPHQLSPFPAVSGGSSPLSATYQPNRLSPSYFLQQRSSPYRPVRPVNSLLVPPPSATVHNVPRSVPLDQMQYRPLARPLADPRTGHLPYYSYQAWPQSHQLNQWSTVSQN